MRLALTMSLVLGLGLAGAASAQPAAPSADNHAQTVSTAVAAQEAEPAKAQTENPQAAAALLVAVRHAEDLERMTKLACAAGDTSKCPKAKVTTPGSPSP